MQQIIQIHKRYSIPIACTPCGTMEPYETLSTLQVHCEKEALFEWVHLTEGPQIH